MSPAIPDRWLNYKPLGKRIEGTRFIAFKVPLRKHVLTAVKEDNRLDVDSLLENVPNLGLIIDLTNTNRYYDPQTVRVVGVQHKKLMIPGHFTPPDHLVDIFKNYVRGFLDENKDNDKLIGVHCTHGVNRTGYLICHYMISELTFNPKDAIERFDTARGHGIERSNYLRALTELRTNSRHISKVDSTALVADPKASQIYNRFSNERKYERREVDPLCRTLDRGKIHKPLHRSDRHYHNLTAEAQNQIRDDLQKQVETSNRYQSYSCHQSRESNRKERVQPIYHNGVSSLINTRQQMEVYERSNSYNEQSLPDHHNANDRYQKTMQQARYREQNLSQRQHVSHITPATETYGAYKRRQLESNHYRKDNRPTTSESQPNANTNWRRPSNGSQPYNTNWRRPSNAVPSYINDYRKKKNQESSLRRDNKL